MYVPFYTIRITDRLWLSVGSTALEVVEEGGRKDYLYLVKCHIMTMY